MSVVWTSLIKIGITLFWVLNLAALLTWVERKQSAVMQDRIGANRANIGPFRMIGLFQIIADSIKMLLKEDWVPPGGNKFLHTIAPMISFFFALMAFAVIPIGNFVQIGGRRSRFTSLDPTLRSSLSLPCCRWRFMAWCLPATPQTITIRCLAH